jgi:hypothetical protein
MPVKERDRGTGEETGETITLFKVVFVFDTYLVLHSADRRAVR